MQLRGRLLVCVRRYGLFLNHGSEITTPKTEIPEVAGVEHCPEYPLASAIGYGCKTFSVFCWTGY
jgi:hypothetical protein